MNDMSRVETIISVVADSHNVPGHMIVSDRRNATIVHARYTVFYLIYALTNYSMPAIGRMFNKDHTTILHGIRKISKKRKEDPLFDSILRLHESTLGHNHHLKSPEPEKKNKILQPVA